MTATGHEQIAVHRGGTLHDPEQVEAALTRWADIIARGGRLSPAELLGQRFTPKCRGYDPAEVKALIDRLIAENT